MLLCCLAQSPAMSADSQSLEGIWQRWETTAGCSVYQHLDSPNNVGHSRITWTGNCGSDKRINGPGTLTYYPRNCKDCWFEWKGSFKSGFADGKVVLRSDQEPNERSASIFVMGCMMGNTCPPRPGQASTTTQKSVDNRSAPVDDGNSASRSTPQGAPSLAARPAGGNGLASFVGTWNASSVTVYRKTGEKVEARPGNGCQYEISLVEMIARCKGAERDFVGKYALQELGPGAFLATVTSSTDRNLPIGRVLYSEYSVIGDTAEMTRYSGEGKEAKDKAEQYFLVGLRRMRDGVGSPQSVGTPTASILPAPGAPAMSAQIQPSAPLAQPVQTGLPSSGGVGTDTTATAPQGRWDDKRCLAEMGRINSDHMERHIPASVKGQTAVQALQLEARYSAGPMKLLFEGPCAGYRTAGVYVAHAMDTLDRAERASRTGVAEPDIGQMKSRMPGKLSDAECQAKITEIHQAISVFGAGARNARDTLEIAYREQGIPQKLLFEGPCSSHPQAGNYLATANKIIADAERTLGVKVGVTKAADNRSAPADYSDRQKVIASSGEPAHQCLSLISEGLYGGFSNSCNFKVYYTYCAYHPRKGTWVDSANYNCESSQNTTPRSDGQTVGPNGQDANHTRGAEKIFWFGCKAPAHPYLVKFNGSGLMGMCRQESS